MHIRHGKMGAVSNQLAAVVLVMIVAVGVLLLVQHRAMNPRRGAIRQTCPVRRGVPLTGSMLPDTIYRQSSTVQLQLQQPTGIAIGPDSALYAVGDKELLKYDNTGKLISKTPLPAEPHAVCIAADGTAYIAVLDHIEVQKEGSASLSSWAKLSGRPYITSVCANASRLWVADAGNRQVLEYDAGGKLTRTLGQRNASKNVRGLIVPSPHMDVALDSKGNLWVADPGRHSLEQYAEDGSVVRTWGKAGGEIEDFGGCCNPSDFAMTLCDEFITSEKGLMRVKLYSPEGKLEGLVATGKEFSGASSAGMGLDLAVGRDCTVYVLDPGARCVRVFSPK